MGEYRRDRTADDEPIGVVYSERRRRWAHRWSEYVVMLLALIGIIAFIGAVAPFSVPRLVGALAILTGAYAFSRSDRLHSSSVPRERVWAGVGVGLAIGGALLFALS